MKTLAAIVISFASLFLALAANVSPPTSGEASVYPTPRAVVGHVGEAQNQPL